MSVINYPIIVLAKDSGEVFVYQNFEDLERAVEKIDIENDEYKAWDTSGHALVLGVQKSSWLRVDLSDSDESGLRAAITEFASSLGIPHEQTDDAPIAKIINDLRSRAAAKPKGLFGKLLSKSRKNAQTFKMTYFHKKGARG